MTSRQDSIKTGNTSKTKKGKTGGVLGYNNGIRNEHLRRNIGKYFLDESTLKPAIGEYYDIDYNRPLYQLTDGKELLQYTHDNDGLYSKYINGLYFGKDDEIEAYSVATPPLDQVKRWHGRYDNYLDYISEVYGEDKYGHFVTFMNDMLSNEYIENALRQTEVGYVKDINVFAALQGAVTTNLNNFNGTDTRLGLIGNQMYAHVLYNGAKFNTARRSDTKYLTPSLYNVYGNNLSNVGELSDILQLGTNEYRVLDQPGNDVHIIHDVLIDNYANNGGIKYLDEVLENANKYDGEEHPNYKGAYSPFGRRYVDIVKTNEGQFEINYDTDGPEWKGDGNNDFEFSAIQPLTYTKYSNYTPYIEASYQEGDIASENGKEPGKDGSLSEFTNPTGITTNSDKSLVYKTQKLFNSHKINTMVSRFHTSDDGGLCTDIEFTDTAKTGLFGNSHGRNLLKLGAIKGEEFQTNGYSNPYCRVWTNHHQYSRVKDLIRPFTEEDGSVTHIMTVGEVQEYNVQSRSFAPESEYNDYIASGGKYLGDNTVLNDNGFVNITPPPSGDGKKYDVTKCMFSLENLAWKDVHNIENDAAGFYLSPEQRGPNGGRIMWFPPYDLSFDETSSANWQSNEFIGRGEKVYTYTNTDRTGTLSFMLLIDHPSIIDNLPKNGKDPDGDLEGDILRYFAGCGMLEPSEDIPTEEQPSDTGKTKTVIEKKSQELTFYVFFPNNYSGSMSNTINPKTLNEIVYNSDEWFDYLMVGQECSCLTGTTDKSNGMFRGYEICGYLSPVTPSSGGTNPRDNFCGISEFTHAQKDQISSDGKTYQEVFNKDREEYLSAAQKQKPGDVDAPNYNKASTTIPAWNYFYRVDRDLRQNYGLEEKYAQYPSYFDEGSYQLNSYFNEEYHVGANCTFAEFAMAVLLYEAGVTSTQLSEYDESGIEIQDLPYMFSHVTNNGANIGTIKTLLIAMEGGMDFTEVTFEGGATEQDIAHSRMLAFRRANTIKQWLLSKNKLGLRNKEDIWQNPTIKVGEVPESAGASALEAKLNRYAKVTIKFNGPEIIYASSTNGSRGGKKSESLEEQDEWKQLYNALLDDGEVTTEFSKIIPDFESKLKEWMTNEKKSLKYSDYDDEAVGKLNIEISVHFNYLWLVLSYSIADEGTNENFKEKLGIVDPEISEETKKILKKISEKKKELKQANDNLLGTQYDLGLAQDDYNKTIEEINVINLTDYDNTSEDEPMDTSVLSTKLDNIKELKKNIERYKKDVAKYKNEVTKLNNEIDELNDQLDATICAEPKEELKKASKERSELDEKINQQQEEYNEEYDNVVAAIDAFQKVADDKNSTKLQLKKVSRDLENAQKKLVQSKEKLDKSNKEYETIMSKIDNLLNQLAGCMNEMEVSVDLDIANYYFYKSNIIENEYEDNPDEPSGEVTYLYDTFPLEISYTEDVPSFTANYFFGKAYNDYCAIKVLNSDRIKSTRHATDYLLNDQSLKSEVQYAERFIQELTHKPKGTDVVSIDDIKTMPHIGDTMNKHVEEVSNALDKLYNSFHIAYPEATYNDMLFGMTDAPQGEYFAEEWEVGDKIYKRDDFSTGYNTFKNTMNKINDDTKEYLMNFVYVDFVNSANTYAEEEIEKEEEVARKAAEEAQAQKLQQAKEDAAKKTAQAEAAKKAATQKRLMFRKKGYEGQYHRYEDEASYFRKLEADDPLVFKQITDKVKYFNPAFHSMSPEGFNARLNFLHQCTRQGHTLSSSESNDNYAQRAGNLAFGRMPICVLKIGDFINTRIVINSVYISYNTGGGMQWDLNPEGIGVQPMMAKVTMSIVLLGGQSLEAPISKLQNAVSFNYYANTGVYDNRADMAYMQGDGNGQATTVYRRTWAPLPNRKTTQQEEIKDNVITPLPTVELDGLVVTPTTEPEKLTPKEPAQAPTTTTNTIPR